jgi:DNA-binding PadR family transcriptional regulator
MASTTRLLVLGVVRIFQPVHGYDVRRELMSWHAEEWASVAPGSIYSALKSLTKEGLIEVVGTGAVGNRPERTSYRLTTRGDQEFRELLRDTWWTVRMPQDPMVAAVSLVGFISREEAISALEARIAHIQGAVTHSEYAITAIDDIETPGHVREMLRLLNARTAAEIDWARAFIARLKAGEYRMLGDPAWKEPATYPGPAPQAKRSRKPARRKKSRS